MKTLLTRTHLIIAALFVVSLGASTAALAQEDPLLEGQIIVRLFAGESIEDFNSQYETTTNRSIASRNIHLLDLPAGANTEQFINDLQASPPPSLWWVEGNYAAETGEGKTGSFYVSGIDAATLFHDQYAWAHIGLGQAHTVTQGQGIIIAVLDTGVNASHPFLKGRVLADGYNFVDRNTDTDDVPGLENRGWGHGTFVSGLILKMAPQAEILPVKVLDPNGVGDTWIVPEGMFYAIDQGAHIINLSLGTTYRSRIIRDAIDEAQTQGIIVIGAAGNLNMDLREHPAGFSSAFGVAATDEDDLKADFSSFYSEINLSAPGVGIYSTIPRNGQKHSYAQWDGTSFSTAFVSGAAALVMAANPDWPANEARIALVFESLEETAAPLPGNPDGMGEGRLDVGEAVFHEPSAAALADFNIVFGNHVEGDLNSLRRRNDGDALIIDSVFGFSATQPNLIDLRIGYVVVGTPFEIEVKITDRMNNPGGAGSLALYHWGLEQFQLIGTYAVQQEYERTRFDDIPAAGYISGNDRIEARVRHSVVATFSATGFRSFFEQVEIGLD